jgi:hypothetical protein
MLIKNIYISSVRKAGLWSTCCCYYPTHQSPVHTVYIQNKKKPKSKYSVCLVFTPPQALNPRIFTKTHYIFTNLLQFSCLREDTFLIKDDFTILAI